MSPHEESLYIEDWRKVARQDWHRIRVMLADGDGGRVKESPASTSPSGIRAWVERECEQKM